jgi:Flp pilus assembly protein TadG
MRPEARKFSALLKSCKRVARSLLCQREGNIAMSFAILSVPVLIGVGVGVDYSRAYNTQSKMQADLDAALVAAVKEVDSLDTGAIQTKVKQWFAAQADTASAVYTLNSSSITVDKVNHTVRAVATGKVPTTLMAIANIKSVDVSVVSSVTGPATSYLEVYIVIDKSSSMLLAATSAGQTTMKNAAGCNFACHDSEGNVPYNGVNYYTNYNLAKALGVKLRADVAVTAASQVVDLVTKSDPAQSHIKVGLYSLGTTANQVLAPTSSMSTVKSVLNDNSKGLTSATSYNYSYFDKSLPALKTLVGSGGDGSTATKPLKLVLILTDGVQSERSWVLNGVSWNSSGKMVSTGTDWHKVAPLNPAWCTSMKDAGATVGVLYTEYLSISDDWGYNSTVGATMSSAKWKSTWGGDIRKGVSSNTARRDYLPYALSDCASSADMFLAANNPTQIENGLTALFQQYLTNVRLTQ